jgi:hypothetical protein
MPANSQDSFSLTVLRKAGICATDRSRSCSEPWAGACVTNRSAVKDLRVEGSGYTRTTLTGKVGSAKVPVKPIRGGETMERESRL